MELLVELKHSPNPDVRGGYWQPPVDSGRARLVPATSTVQASKLCREFIERNELGGGNWSGGKLYEVVAGKKKLIGNISYNGRVWDLQGLEMPPRGALVQETTA
jgi:hypothetical protein